MGRDTWVPSSPLVHTTLSHLLLYTANAICVRDDLTLVLVTLREKNGCQQTTYNLQVVVFAQSVVMFFGILCVCQHFAIQLKKPTLEFSYYFKVDVSHIFH